MPVLKDARRLGLKAPFVITVLSNMSDLVESAGADACEGAYYIMVQGLMSALPALDDEAKAKLITENVQEYLDFHEEYRPGVPLSKDTSY